MIMWSSRAWESTRELVSFVAVVLRDEELTLCTGPFPAVPRVPCVRDASFTTFKASRGVIDAFPGAQSGWGGTSKRF